MKRILSLTLTVVLLLSMCVSVMAAEPTTEEQLNMLAEKYGIEILEVNNSNLSEPALIFDSVEEFEDFIIELRKPQNFNISQNAADIIQPNDLNGSHTIKWWAPFSTGLGAASLFNYKHIAFEYTYAKVNGKPQFTSVSNITSYMTGSFAMNWVQTVAKFSYKSVNSISDTVSINVEGYFELKVTIAGLETHTQIPDTWNGEYTLE